MSEVIMDFSEGKIISGYTEQIPFDKSLKKLREKGLEIIPCSINLELLMQAGQDSYLLDPKNRLSHHVVSEALIYFPNDQERILLTKKSPAVQLPELLSEDLVPITSLVIKRNGHLLDGYIESAISNGIWLKNTPGFSYKVPTNKFGDDELTTFLFGEVAQEGGEYLHDHGINRLEILYSAHPCYFHGKKGSFLMQLDLGISFPDDPLFYFGNYSNFGTAFSRVRGFSSNKL